MRWVLWAPWAAKSIVDLGCGSGFWHPRYARSAGTVIGVEPDTRLLAAARARTSADTVLHGSAENLPLDDGRVDVIHARFAYFFPSATNDCSAALAEALRMLRPGGSLIVSDNDHHHGEFAALLGRSSWAGSQGHDEYIRRWWAEAGAQRHEVLSSWRFQTPRGPVPGTAHKVPSRGRGTVATGKPGAHSIVLGVHAAPPAPGRVGDAFNQDPTTGHETRPH